jgi:predicted ATPase
MRSLFRIEIENFLSFREASIDFAELSVLVGPNAAGKTNLLKLFKFLGDTARTDLMPALETFGGMGNVLFAGERKNNTVKISVDAKITKHATDRASDNYELRITERSLPGTARGYRTYITRQEKFIFKRVSGPGRRITLSGGSIVITPTAREHSSAPVQGAVQKMKVQPQSAGLATLRRLGQNVDASQVDELATLFERLRVFDVTVSSVRAPSVGPVSSDLAADASNIGCYLAYLSEEHPLVFEALVYDLKQIVPGLQELIVTKNSDGFIIELQEAGLSRRTSLRQASFGTIRSIALFAMLHDPDPPKLTCIEEVDHGLHPYALDVLVDRMRTASEKTQLIVATHSPALVNRLLPEELIIFERNAETGETRIPKVDASEIAEMERVSGLKLGELWFSGNLGGVL